jgi:hypothetical protein
MATDKKSKKTSGMIEVLQIISYKDGDILIRKFPKDMYVWDVFFRGRFYSSYVVIKPVKGEKELNEAEVAEVIKILYAGAAATIDYQRGDKVSEKDEEMVKMFEKGRRSVGGEA